MAITPPTYTPSGSLFGTTTTTTTPYTYGNLGNNTSAYNIWGSKGNPYLIAGPTYTPGSGAPITPHHIAPIYNPMLHNGDDSPVAPWVDPNSAESQAKSYGDLQNWLDRDRTKWKVGSSLLGAPLLDPAIDLMYGINPYTQQSFSWYDGSTDDFGYVGSDNTLEGKDLSAAVAAYDLDFEAGMTDLSQDEYIAQYMAEREASNATAVETPGLFGGFFDNWFTQDPSNVQVEDKGQHRAVNGWSNQNFADPASKVAIEARKNVATGVNKDTRVAQAQAQARAQAQAQAQAAQEDAVRAAQRAETARVRREIYGDDGGGSPPPAPLDPFGSGMDDLGIGGDDGGDSNNNSSSGGGWDDDWGGGDGLW